MYSKIVLPTRAQPDTIVAIFVLKYLGEEKFPGISEASIEVWQEVPEGSTEEFFDDRGIILIDLGGGRFDHHNKTPRTTASELVSQYLNQENNPALSKLLEYAKRDDFFGKGIISEDPLDRAFGLSGLIANLNRKYVQDTSRVVQIVLPVIEAHYDEEYRRTKELPEEFNKRLSEGNAEIFTTSQRKKNLKCVFLLSDSASMAGFLRSQNGGRFDVVAQQLSSGHVNILTRPTKHIDLRALVASIRATEMMKDGKDPLPLSTLAQAGRIDVIPEWYFDPATNSIQNGGLNPSQTPPTKITRAEITELLSIGLSEQVWAPGQ